MAPCGLGSPSSDPLKQNSSGWRSWGVRLHLGGIGVLHGGTPTAGTTSAVRHLTLVVVNVLSLPVLLGD